MADPSAALRAAGELLAQGKAAEALARVEAWLAAHPGDLQAHMLRVNAANALGDLDRVIDGLLALLRLRPQHPQFTRMLATALNNHGARLRESGRLDAALAAFRQAVDLFPAHPQAWFNLGLCLRDRGQPEAAREAFRQHLGLCPDDPPARLLLAGLESDRRLGEALAQSTPQERERMDPAWLAQTAAKAGLVDATLEALARLGPEHDLETASRALCELNLRGEVAGAAAGSQRVIEAAQRQGRLALRAELVGALALPAIYRDHADLLEHRQRYAEGLARLHRRWPDLPLEGRGLRLRELAHSNFLLAYQGLPDRELQASFARLIEQTARRIRPDLAEPPAAARAGRIGLISSCWRSCTVGAYFGGWIGWLREAGFEVFLYQLGPRRDGTTERLGQQATVFRFLEGPIEALAEAVRKDALELLIYPELGMDDRLVPLAALRLARRQALAWGHPTTSGHATMDAYLTCAEMEPETAPAHYTEPLIGLPGLGVDYQRPPRPEPLAAQALGLDPRRPRVLVPQSLFKLHPDTDRVLVAIAEQVPEVQFVLFEPEFPAWRRDYEARLTRAGAGVLDVQRHLCFLPIQPRQRYLQVNMACDVMLDSLHWSGGNTAIDALCCGLPLVACPGALMRGRQSLAMLQRMGLAGALCVADPGQQARRVVELLRVRSEREALREAILARLPALLEARQARAALIEAAQRLTG